MSDQERLKRIDRTMFSMQPCGLSGVALACNFCGATVGNVDVHRLWHLTGERPPAPFPECEAADFEAARKVLGL